MPSRHCPPLDIFIDWIYVVDLDQNVFRVYCRNDAYTWNNCGIQYFRLDNIPRWLFNLEPADDTSQDGKIYSIYPIATASVKNVPIEHWADNICDIPPPQRELCDLYRTLSPQQLRIPKAAIAPAWKTLQIQLLGQLVEYFLQSSHDVCPSPRSSPFVIRQLAYAVLCFTQSGASAGMKFQSTDAPHKVLYCRVRGGAQTPAWEPPDSNSYWIGNVFILLDQYIHDPESATAAVAKVVQLVTAVCASSKPEVKAVIFSIYCIIIVSIRRTPEGGLQISRTPELQLLCSDSAATALGSRDMKILRADMFATPGIEALIDLFASCAPQTPPPPQSFPANLPPELSQQIFRCADPCTQSALEASCRLFREIAAEYPRLGEWTLLKCTAGPEFVAFRSSTQSQHVVRLKPMSGRYKRFPSRMNVSGFEVGLWGRGVQLSLNLPLFNVRVVTVDKTGI